MSEQREHDALRDEFQRLRSETGASGRVPDFGAMMARAKAEAQADAAARPQLTAVAGSADVHGGRRPRRAIVIGGWASVALAAAIAGILLVEGHRGSADARFESLVAAYSAESAGGAWSSPTANLLDVPGMSLTRTMPAVGDPLRDFDPGEAAGRRDAEGRDS